MDKIRREQDQESWIRIAGFLSTLLGGGIAVTCFAGAFKLLGVISSSEVDQSRYLLAFLFTCFVLLSVVIYSHFSQVNEDLKQQLVESKEETSKMREEKDRELAKAMEEISREREKSKEHSEDWHIINKQRKDETMGKETAERKVKALEHQVEQQEERLFKMEIPLDKMKESNIAPIKDQVFNKMKKLEEENGKLVDDLNKERKLHEACKTDLKLSLAKSDQLQKGIEQEMNEQIKLREESSREREQERQLREKGQQRIEELDRLYRDEKKIKEERGRNLELITAARDQEIQKRKDTEKQRDEQIQMTDRRTKERDQERNKKLQEMKRAKELEGELANLQTKEKNLRETHVDEVTVLLKEHEEKTEKLQNENARLTYLAGRKALEKDGEGYLAKFGLGK